MRLRLFASAFALAVAARGTAAPAAPVPYGAVARANERAAGNRPAEAIAIGRSVYATLWPAQVTKVRVDAAGPTSVAGLVVEGEHFHADLDWATFSREIAELVRRSFAAAPVDEVDVWATVPIAVPAGAIVSGDYAIPTTKTVFSITVRRRDLDSLEARLANQSGVFVDRGWRMTAFAAGDELR